LIESWKVPVTETPSICSAIPRPPTPVKVALAFWPGVVVVSVRGAPPGVIEARGSAGTS
jgi:hypothetical protein